MLPFSLALHVVFCEITGSFSNLVRLVARVLFLCFIWDPGPRWFWKVLCDWKPWYGIFIPFSALNNLLFCMKEFLSALELGFIILSVHYISSAASAPFNAIYQSPVLPSFFFLFWEPVLPSFRKVMRRHCHFGRLLPAKRTRALPLPDSDSPPLLSRVISPDDSPASRMPSLYFLAPLWLCCPIFCAFLRSKSAALPPVSTLEPW